MSNHLSLCMLILKFLVPEVDVAKRNIKIFVRKGLKKLKFLFRKVAQESIRVKNERHSQRFQVKNVCIDSCI